MKLEFHTLYWPNTDERIVESHKQVMAHKGLPINYHKKKIDHGEWMDYVMLNSSADIIGFWDVDCVPICSKEILIDYYVNYVRDNKTFIGIAQVANHILPATHVYAAPAFFVIDRNFWLRYKGVSFKAGQYHDQKNNRIFVGDVCENFCYVAEQARITYQCLYPTHYYTEPSGGLWRLSNYGWYGIGTIFDKNIYHLYQSRYNDNIELFEQHCNDIINDKLDFFTFFNAMNKWP